MSAIPEVQDRRAAQAVSDQLNHAEAVEARAAELRRQLNAAIKSGFIFQPAPWAPLIRDRFTKQMRFQQVYEILLDALNPDNTALAISTLNVLIECSKGAPTAQEAAKLVLDAMVTAWADQNTGVPQ